MRLTTDSFIIDRFFARLPWSWRWSVAIVGAVLFLIPLALLWLTEMSDPLFALEIGVFRVFFPGIVTVYLLIVVHLLEQTREKVARSLRPLLQIDDETFVAEVRRACQANPVGELIGAGIGILFFFAVVGYPVGGTEVDWLGLYYYLGSMLMFGAVGWCVYAVIVISRLTNTLLRQPIEVDIFDVTPFQPIGTQSLYLSLSILGIVVLAFPSSPYALPSWQNILITIALILVSVIVFFANMYSTHRLLASTREQQMAIAGDKLAQSYHQLQELDSSRQDIYSTAMELNAWSVAKHELKQTRSWPYNTEMLRTLFVSVLIPIVMGVARILFTRR